MVYFYMMERKLLTKDLEPRFKFPLSYSELVRYHVIQIDPDARGGQYNQVRSLQSFNAKEKGVDLLNMRYFHNLHCSPDEEHLNKFLPMSDCDLFEFGIEKYERVDHESVWAYYEHIGYDFRAVKYNG